jgi:hypothetical protein
MSSDLPGLSDEDLISLEIDLSGVVTEQSLVPITNQPLPEDRVGNLTRLAAVAKERKQRLLPDVAGSDGSYSLVWDQQVSPISAEVVRESFTNANDDLARNAAITRAIEIGARSREAEAGTD